MSETEIWRESIPEIKIAWFKERQRKRERKT
jgi:hypothetical protein